MRSVCLLLSLCLAPASAAQLTVTGVQPARNAVGVSTHPRVVLSFGTAVAPATAVAANVQVFGRWSGVMDGAITLEAGGRDLVFEPARPFFPGELVMVSASSAVAAAGGGALQGGHAFSFWVGAAAGSMTFDEIQRLSTRRAGEGRVRTYGANAVDLDRDGRPDLSLPNEDTNDVRVMYGDGCTSFGALSVAPLPAYSIPSPNEAQDYNGDGWVDLAVGCSGTGTLAVFLNDGAGGYQSSVIYPSGVSTLGVATLDVEGDGDADVVTANRGSSKLALHRNRGDGTFDPAVLFEGNGQQERGVAAGDANNDGWTDLFVANFEGQVSILLSDGAGGFTVGGSAAVGAGPWMIVTGDVNGDGNIDAVTADSGFGRTSVVFGDGAGGVSAVQSYPVGGFPIAVDLGDLDGDGRLDVVVSSFASSDFTVYRGTVAGLASRQNLPATSAGSCALLVDFDRDGDVDILGIDELDDWVFLFAQRGPSPSGVQAPACTATQRVDNLANRGGYAGAAAHRVDIGRSFFVGVTGPASAPFATAFGLRQEPGLTTPFGLLNLGVLGLVTLPAGVTDAEGEALQRLPVPATLSPGQALALQTFVLQSAAPLQVVLSNPERVVMQ
ncbi:MAG: VCBS repeat-containing protein [Planctomycetota bacterium]